MKQARSGVDLVNQSVEPRQINLPNPLENALFMARARSEASFFPLMQADSSVISTRQDSPELSVSHVGRKSPELSVSRVPSESLGLSMSLTQHKSLESLVSPAQTEILESALPLEQPESALAEAESAVHSDTIISTVPNVVSLKFVSRVKSKFSKMLRFAKPNKPVVQLETSKKSNLPKSKWQKYVNNFNVAAEASNSGILLEIIRKWVPAISKIYDLPIIFGFITLTSFIFFADPLIYFFRSLVRLTRIVGRTVFKIKFDEEAGGTHRYQTLGDIFSLSCFVMAIVFFAGAIVSPPVGITLAWGMALCGLTSVGFFDYIWPEKLAKEKHQSVVDQLDTPENIALSQKNYQYKRNAKNLYVALLIGLALLLICGSAAAFAPPVLASVFTIVSKVASIYLGAIACGRAINWYLEKANKQKEEKKQSIIPPVVTEVVASENAQDDIKVSYASQAGRSASVDTQSSKAAAPKTRRASIGACSSAFFAKNEIDPKFLLGRGLDERQVSPAADKTSENIQTISRCIA